MDYWKKTAKQFIVHSDLLLNYLKIHYPELYYVSSTTKVLTEFAELEKELQREEFRYVVPDFRLNKMYDRWNALQQSEKDKVEFLCNECCWYGCKERKQCYETVSRKNLGERALLQSTECSNRISFFRCYEEPGFYRN